MTLKIPAVHTFRNGKHVAAPCYGSGGSSSGSGTDNYNDLTHKPAIDGVVLTETSTAAGLGLAKAADLQALADIVAAIPRVRVYQNGVWRTAATDIYIGNQGGEPADLSADAIKLYYE